MPHRRNDKVLFSPAQWEAIYAAADREQLSFVELVNRAVEVHDKLVSTVPGGSFTFRHGEQIRTVAVLPVRLRLFGGLLSLTVDPTRLARRR